MAQKVRLDSMVDPRFHDHLESWGGLRRVNMVQNGHMASPGPLERVSGGPQRVHEVSWDGHESSCEGLYGPEWSPGALGRISGGPERVSWAACEGLWRSSEERGVS